MLIDCVLRSAWQNWPAMNQDGPSQKVYALIAPHTESLMFKSFRLLGWIEGASMVILLFVAMPMKYVFHIPEATKITGTLHGILFMLYVVLAFNVTIEYNWPKSLFLKAFWGAVYPFGTFIFDRKYLTSQKKNG